MVETLKRKLEEERQREEEEEVAAENDRENKEPVKKKIMVEQVILMNMLEKSAWFSFCRNVTSATSNATVKPK